jgi:NitT/TauT family transport system ATP-binding protein
LSVDRPAQSLPQASPHGADLIQIGGLEKRFQTRANEPVNALTGVNLNIRNGEFICVVGPSGCGKTTLMRILAGLERGSAGTVTIEQEPITGPREDIAVVFQQATLLPWFTVLENVLLPARLKGERTSKTRSRASELLHLVGLGEFERKYPFELSGGMQQRVSICRALLRDPKILLMDEPFGALDALSREALNIELLRIWGEQHKTILFITHSIPEAVFLGERVVVMSPRPGRITSVMPIEIESPRTIHTMGTAEFGKTCDAIRAALSGASAMASG